MKRKSYSNDAFKIIARTPDDFTWQVHLETINTPATLMFAISSNNIDIEIKKITWDFGTGNLNKSITNRKQNLNELGIQCKYKKSHNNTITICASVYTDKGMFTPKPIETVTINQMIKEHYVQPEEFKNQILKYYKTNKFTDDVAESIYKIANRLAFAPNFINYTYREEMVGDAVVRMIEALTSQKFDPLKGNPFSYFTKIAFHAFCNRIKKEKKIREALVNYQNDIYNEMVDENLIPHQKSKMNDDSGYHEDF